MTETKDGLQDSQKKAGQALIDRLDNVIRDLERWYPDVHFTFPITKLSGKRVDISMAVLQKKAS